MQKISVLGIGLMGLPMAHNLIKTGFDVTVWNRTESKTKPLVDAGARFAQSPQEAVKDVEIIIAMLENGDAVEEVLFTTEAYKNITENAVIIDMGSIPPALAKDHSVRLQSLNIHHLDAPVSGGTKGAEAASLAIMVGGKKEIFERAAPIFNALGHATYIGPSGTGQISKCCNQVIVANTIAAISEGLLLAKMGGADPAAVRQALSGGFADSRILQEHGKRILERNFAPGAPNRIQLKDINTALDAVECINLPVTEKVKTLYVNLINNGMADLDHSSLFLELEKFNIIE